MSLERSQLTSLSCSSTTAAVIIKVEGGMLRIMDQDGAVRLVRPQQVASRREKKEYVSATDSQQNEMRPGDAMKETQGEVR